VISWVEYDRGEALQPHAAIEGAYHALLSEGVDVDTGHWQGYPTGGKPDLVTKEIINLSFTARIPHTVPELEREVKPNLPWAEVEFLERVGRVGRNPHASLQQWPHWREQSDSTMYNGMFSHTYSERFWPNDTGEDPVGRLRGIRYAYGDLDDVLTLLRSHPHTRQATFPIFFPEDTGATHGGRIPCTLHYHFLLRQDRLHMWYPIRSCDAHRHFRDDVYMAMRLNQWVIEEILHADNDYPEQALWENVRPGTLCFTAYSFHLHHGDLAVFMRDLTTVEHA
jgi:hypothetical protein